MLTLEVRSLQKITTLDYSHSNELLWSWAGLPPAIARPCAVHLRPRCTQKVFLPSVLVSTFFLVLTYYERHNILPPYTANYRLDSICNIATAIAEKINYSFLFIPCFFRIIRMLVIEKYLWEDLVVTRDQMATAYLRPGTKAQLLIQVSCATSISRFPLCSPLCNVSDPDSYGSA